MTSSDDAINIEASNSDQRLNVEVACELSNPSSASTANILSSYPSSSNDSEHNCSENQAEIQLVNENVATTAQNVVPFTLIGHSRRTRAQSGIIKPNIRYVHTEQMCSEPKSVKEALQHQGWLQATREELEALEINCTWTLVPRTVDMHIIVTK